MEICLVMFTSKIWMSGPSIENDQVQYLKVRPFGKILDHDHSLSWVELVHQHWGECSSPFVPYCPPAVWEHIFHPFILFIHGRKSKKEPSPDITSPSTLTFKFTASKSVRYRFPSFVNYTAWNVLFQKLEQTKMNQRFVFFCFSK